ncbi:class I SAM-dependent methyltransferase [Halobacterium rubrum]|uniref:class I SAM-dependent methyltransferase n=1 Tax=Halobacterium TaxID=2239 RepID=UPI001F27763E|nr:MULTISPECIES: class I SAM-dependent methyltransferase [Halobacterium]MDH5019722.1 class I SAM-dependent methyltransferase [Halobacterium rubrum]
MTSAEDGDGDGDERSGSGGAGDHCGEEAAKTWWDAWADHFQTVGDIDVGVARGPGAPHDDDLGLLGDVAGEDVVELGCGGAQFGLALADRGADYTGVDLSSAQLAHARANAAGVGASDATFIEASVTDLPLPTDAFDLAVSAFAFQWVEDLTGCFREAHRVLRPGGRLVFSVDHPCYKLFDPESGDVARSYFGDSPRREYSEPFDAEMVVYSRPVSETVAHLDDAGFTVEAIREPGYADPDEYESAFGGFDPELMADVPPTVVYAARACPEL